MDDNHTEEKEIIDGHHGDFYGIDIVMNPHKDIAIETDNGNIEQYKKENIKCKVN